MQRTTRLCSEHMQWLTDIGILRTIITIFTLKKLSGLLSNIMRPTGCRGKMSSGQVLVSSRGSTSNMSYDPSSMVWIINFCPHVTSSSNGLTQVLQQQGRRLLDSSRSTHYKLQKTNRRLPLESHKQVIQQISRDKNFAAHTLQAYLQCNLASCNALHTCAPLQPHATQDLSLTCCDSQLFCTEHLCHTVCQFCNRSV